MSSPDLRPPVGVHLSNVSGTGAVRLAQSLLPALMSSRVARVRTLYLPAQGSLAGMAAGTPGIDRVLVRRLLPKALSRLAECLLPDKAVRADEPLLVLGDLPLRAGGRQTLFVQTPHLTSSASVDGWVDKVRFAVARAVLRHNLPRVSTVIVQTPMMQAALVSAHPALAARTQVVGQPPPDWLTPARASRIGPVHAPSAGLRLAYPAAGYPHKNHALFGTIAPAEADRWPVHSLVLTLKTAQNPAPHMGWIHMAGPLEPAAMVALYRDIDALVFPSLEESYGFPLVEAMAVGIPIVCADRPYARGLCGDMAIYFDPRSAESLRCALVELQARLAAGWWPDWSAMLNPLPSDWQAVADRFLEIALDAAEPQTARLPHSQGSSAPPVSTGPHQGPAA